MATQLEQLPINIEKLTDKVYELTSKTFLVPPIPSLVDLIRPYLMTDRQIAKKIILIVAGSITSAGKIIESVSVAAGETIAGVNSLVESGSNMNSGMNNIMNNNEMAMAINASIMIGQKVTPETAHFIVYGKFKRDDNGKLIDNEILDPDCVLTKIAMPSIHPTMSSIKVMIAQVINTLKMMGIKQAQLLDDIAQTSIAISASITSIASAAVILPPGAGIPVAFAAFQGLMANIMALINKITSVLLGVEYLNYLPLLVEAEKIDTVIGLVNTQIIALYTILNTIDGLIKILPIVPTPPGVGNVPGNPVTIEVTATPNIITIGVPIGGQDVTLKATASNGSWEFDYKWTGPDGFNWDEKEVTIQRGPFETSTYTCTATDKKDSANSASGSVTVTVV